MVFKALGVLVNTFPVTDIYLPSWQGYTLQNAGWSAWETLVRKAQDHRTTVSLVDEPTTLTFGSTHMVLTPAPKYAKRNKLVYHELIPKLNPTYA